MKASHNLDRLGVTFDDLGLVADAGLLLTATLAQRLGLRATLDRRLKLGRVAGAANAGQKAMTLIASILAGGDTIDDANALRAGSAGPYSVTARRGDQDRPRLLDRRNLWSPQAGWLTELHFSSNEHAWTVIGTDTTGRDTPELPEQTHLLAWRPTFHPPRTLVRSYRHQSSGFVKNPG